MATQINGQDQGGSGHTIQNETTPLTARANMNFTGAGVTAADNAGAGTTDVTIAGGGGAGITDITYADLVTAIGGSTLTPGGLYRITDFKTTHYIVDGAGTRYFTKIAQVDTITLAGTSGTASITDAGGLTKTVTFNNNLTTTASDFVTAFAADYLAQDIVLTSSTVDLIFTANVAGTGFTNPAIANVTGDLTGTVVNTTLNDDPIIIGNLEHLIFTATSANAINREVYSVEYPQDIIHYDWNPANWLDDLSFADAEVTALVIIPGFKGVITFRHDTLLDNYTGYDFRECKSRRWKPAVSGWDSGVEYHADDFSKHSNKIWIGIATGTNKEPGIETTYWKELINLNKSEYVFPVYGGTNGIPANPGEYADFKTFSEGTGTATYVRCCRANHIESFKDDYSTNDISKTMIGNHVFFLEDNASFVVFSNSIGSECFYFTSTGLFAYNLIGSDCTRVLFLYDCQDLIIGHYCQENLFVNAYDCQMGSVIKNLITAPGFQMNRIEDNFTGINFSPATHVYAAYNCTLFTDSLGNKKLSYIDGTTGLLVVVDANA